MKEAARLPLPSRQREEGRKKRVVFRAVEAVSGRHGVRRS
jgi:hypothetical protein